jgi:hypothetical protein
MPAETVPIVLLLFCFSNVATIVLADGDDAVAVEIILNRIVKKK